MPKTFRPINTLTLVTFVERICEELGASNKRPVLGTNGICTVRWLRDHHDFTFRTESYQLLIGANVVKVWYHPGRRHNNKINEVFEIEWQGRTPRGVKPITRSPKREWEERLREVMRAYRKEKKHAPNPPLAREGRRIHFLP